MNQESPNVNKFSNAEHNNIERNFGPSSIASNDNSSNNSNESSNLSTCVQQGSPRSTLENNKKSKYDHNWKKIQSDHSYDFLSKDICHDLEKSNRSALPCVTNEFRTDKACNDSTTVCSDKSFTHEEMYHAIFSKRRNNFSTNDKDISSLSFDESTHQTHINVVPEIVNLIDYIGPESTQKYPFVFPSYLHDNSQDGINRLVGLLRLSGDMAILI